MNDHRDRLIDLLLEEELGGHAPPDLTRRVLARAFPARRPWLRIVAAAALLLVAVGVGWYLIRSGYPGPKAVGSFEVVDGGAVRRGAALRARNGTATLELGGYSQLVLQPGAQVRIEGKEFAEEVSLETGEVHCQVDRNVGTFAVRTPSGTVSVKGTTFTVQLIEEKGEKAMVERRLFVRVLSGSVLLAGIWGTMALTEGESAAADEKGAEKKSGTVVGKVTGKGENFIEILADGEERTTRYVLPWVGGTPAQGGGPDKKLAAEIGKVPVNSRVRATWFFEERKRVKTIEVLKGDDKK